MARLTSPVLLPIALRSSSLVLLCLSTALAQTAPPPPDPYIGLMQSQPKLEANSPPNPTANFDPPAIHPGENALYRVTFNSLEQMVQWPTNLAAAPKGLELQPGAHGQTFQMVGPGVMTPLSAFNTRVSVNQTGAFTIPEFAVSVDGKPVKIPAATLTVTTDPILSRAPYRLVLETGRKEASVGESVTARVFLLGTPGVFQALQQPQITGAGVIVDQGAVRQQMGAFPASGTNMAVYTYETVLTPIESGKLSLVAQGFISGNRLPGNVVITMPGMPAMGPPSLLESAPVELIARPLSREGQLPGFTGTIGKVTVDTPTLDTNSVHVGEPVKLTVTVHAPTNLARLIAPPPPKLPDWEIFAGNSNSPSPQLAQIRHSFTFDYTLIPLLASNTATPPIPFSYYDPAQRKYGDATIPSVPLKIIGTADAASAAALVQSVVVQTNTEPDSALSPPAKTPGRRVGTLLPLQLNPWFPLIQFAPATLFGGLWYWDRRRRYLRQHPEIVLRRKARRALRREKASLRKAVHRRDGPAFAIAAVRAMRIACAPHYPAEPRALVGADVLQVLDEPERLGNKGKAVRDIFTATDALTFSSGPKPNGELLKLQPEFEGVLQSLEAKL